MCFFVCVFVIIVLCYSGPLVLLRVELGVLSRGNLRPLEVVSEYIQQNDVEKVSQNNGKLFAVIVKSNIL